MVDMGSVIKNFVNSQLQSYQRVAISVLSQSVEPMELYKLLVPEARKRDILIAAGNLLEPEALHKNIHINIDGLGAPPFVIYIPSCSELPHPLLPLTPYVTRESKLYEHISMALEINSEWAELIHVFDSLYDILHPSNIAMVFPWIRNLIIDDSGWWNEGSKQNFCNQYDVKYTNMREKDTVTSIFNRILQPGYGARLPSLTKRVHAIAQSGNKLFTQVRIVRNSDTPSSSLQDGLALLLPRQQIKSDIQLAKELAEIKAHYLKQA